MEALLKQSVVEPRLMILDAAESKNNYNVLKYRSLNALFDIKPSTVCILESMIVYQGTQLLWGVLSSALLLSWSFALIISMTGDFVSIWI